MTDSGDRDPGADFDFDSWVSEREQAHADTLEGYTVDHEVAAQAIVDTHDQVLGSLLQSGVTEDQLAVQLFNLRDHVTGELAQSHTKIGTFLKATHAYIARLVSYDDRRLLTEADEELEVSGPGTSVIDTFGKASSPQDARLLALAHDYSLWEQLHVTASRQGLEHPDIDRTLEVVSSEPVAWAMRAGLDHLSWRSKPSMFAYRSGGEEGATMVPKAASTADVRAAMAAGSDYAVLLTMQKRAEHLPAGTALDTPESLLELATPLGRLLIDMQELKGRGPTESDDEPRPPRINVEEWRSLIGDGHHNLGVIGLALQSLYALQFLSMSEAIDLERIGRLPVPSGEEGPDVPSVPDLGRGGVELSLYRSSTLSAGSIRQPHKATGSNDGEIRESNDADDD
ncbi:MAG TPA: hypothetical protein VN554_01040 [Verrucomicrobiae bacterium]|nr:hypothetical protein [Verrucomicrobiae bacterium]